MTSTLKRKAGKNKIDFFVQATGPFETVPNNFDFTGNEGPPRLIAWIGVGDSGAIPNRSYNANLRINALQNARYILLNYLKNENIHRGGYNSNDTYSKAHMLVQAQNDSNAMVNVLLDPNITRTRLRSIIANIRKNKQLVNIEGVNIEGVQYLIPRTRRKKTR